MTEDTKALADRLATAVVANGRMPPSRDLLDFLGGPLQAHQNRLIELHKRANELTPSEIEAELARLGYELNETIFYMLTNGAELSNFVEPPLDSDGVVY